LSIISNCRCGCSRISSRCSGLSSPALMIKCCLATGRYGNQRRQRIWQLIGKQQQAEARKASWVANRLSNDNSYLSWTRNGMLSSIAALTAHGIQSPVHDQSVCLCLFAYSTVSMTIGTALYARNLHTMRWDFAVPAHVHYAKLTGALLQLLLWWVAVAMLWQSFAEYHMMDDEDELNSGDF
ncbi:hypothetical protein BOX15_Mlig022501g1, partial [Macrostomum lignano]